MLDRVIAFLSGDDTSVTEELERLMLEASKNMQFEKAALYRDRLQRHVDEIMQRQKAVSMRGDDYDVLACASDGVDATVQALFMRDGKLLGSEAFVMERGAGESAGELIESFILQYYDEDHPIPPMILTPGIDRG